MFYEVIPEGKVEVLTYDFDGSLLPGQIVLVPISKRMVPGVVVKKVAQPNFKTKTISKVLYSKPLPKHLLETVRFVHGYYLAPSGQAISLVLPKGVEKKRRKTEQMFGNTSLGDIDSYALSRSASKTTVATGVLALNLALPGSESPSIEHTSQTPRNINHNTNQPNIPLNSSQKNALEGLQKAVGTTKLLFGVTGSGKTNIYLKMAENALKQHLSTILLVPEIALTSQLVKVFGEYFSDRVIVIHSGLTEVERHLIFERILLNEDPLIIIGARSALFAPVSNLGLIIIDEEHDGAYYQENSPKYSAIRVASFIAKSTGASLVLGSATPNIEDYYLASRQNSLVVLKEKAKSSATKPEMKIIDFRDRNSFTRNRYFSNSLLKAIEENLEHKCQTLVFHNRRGSSPLTICESCGEELLCPNCFLPLTLHADEYALHCHTCGFSEKVPISCPKCGAPGLVHKGFGTKLLETELRKLFPDAVIKRFDADNKKGEGLDAQYSAVRDGEVDILVGTQTLTKGLDLPKLTTVGVVQADAGLSLPDYMAEERTFQLLTQVIGRVGRGHATEAKVFIQTFRPEHPVLQFAENEDYVSFYEYLIKKRKKAGFPPFRFILKLEMTMKTEAIVLKKVRETVKRLSRDTRLIVSPPQPGFHERTIKGFTWQIVVRSKSRKALVEACEGLDKNFKITLDPPGLL